MKAQHVFAAILMMATCVQADPRQWDTLGVAVRQGAYIHWEQQTSPHSDGSTLVVWSDMRTGERDIYAQRISAAGDLMWAADGICVCGDPTPQGEPTAVAVTDGWIVTWIDFRNELDCSGDVEFPCGDVYAQKITLNGDLSWPDNGGTGVAVDVYPSRVLTESLQIAPSMDNGAYIAWEDSRLAGSYSEVLVQRLSGAGVVQWAQAERMSENENLQLDLKIAGDGVGNLLAIWSAYNDAEELQLYAGKMNPQADRVWDSIGRVVAGNVGSVSQGKIIADGSGGCIIAWADWRLPYGDLYAQRLDSAGEVLWQEDGIVVCNAANSQIPTALKPSFTDGMLDGCLVLWSDSRSSGDSYYIFAQKVSLAGERVWDPDGVHVVGDPGDYTIYTNTLASDGDGGALVAWYQATTDTSGSPMNVYVTRLDGDGEHVWTPEAPCLLCGIGGEPTPVIQPLGDQFMMITGTGGLGTVMAGDIRYQLAAIADAQPEFSTDGQLIISGFADGAWEVQGASMSDSRAALVWMDYRDVLNTTLLFYQILNTEGEAERPVNGSVLLAPASHYGLRPNSPMIASDGNGGFFATCATSGSPPFPLLFAHVNSAGELVTPEAGVEFVQPEQNHWLGSPHCVEDGTGGVFVAWTVTETSGPGNYVTTVLVTRLTSTGEPVWTEPAAVTDNTDECYLDALVKNSDASCTALWTSGPSTDSASVFAARVTADAGVEWTTEIRHQTALHSAVAAEADGQDGMYAVWLDSGSPPNTTLRAQHLNVDGAPTWANGGVPMDTMANWYANVAAIVSGSGDLYVVWSYADPNQNADLFAQRISINGTVHWGEGGMTVCAPDGQQYEPCIAVDGYGGLFVAWSDGRETSDRVWATYLDANGNPVPDPYWIQGQGGLISPLVRKGNGPVVVKDGSGFVIAWRNSNVQGPYYPSVDIYAQRVGEIADGARPSGIVIPVHYSLRENYPNPFNPVTEISFAIPATSHTKLTVFDLLGRQVSTLVEQTMTAGDYRIPFDASALPSGVYFYRLEAGSFTASRKMVLLK